MDVDRFLPGVIGAFVGVLGWLLVGLYIQRRQFVRQARNAARAVYFEVDVNRMNVEVARDYGSVSPFSRSPGSPGPPRGAPPHPPTNSRPPASPLRVDARRPHRRDSPPCR